MFPKESYSKVNLNDGHGPRRIKIEMIRIVRTWAVLILCTAISIFLASCGKQPDPFILPEEENGRQTQDPESPGPQEPSAPVVLGISIPTDTTLFSYKGVPSELYFTVDGADSTVDVRITVNPYAGFDSFNLEKADDGCSGKVSFTLGNDKASFLLLVASPDTAFSRTVSVEAYFASLTGVSVGYIIDDDGTGQDIRFGVDTNIPDAEDVLIVESESDWITITCDAEGYVATVARNITGEVRDADIVLSHKDGFLSTASFSVIQDWLLFTPEGDYVAFAEKPFKAACLKAADINGDHQVSFDEAEAVRELYVRGRGITDLTGLERFVNLEFFEAQDNDIRNADMLAELHLLHWLDLTGNMNLESFDVTGCSVYFERCWYEVTKQLRYKTFMRQLNITFDCDTYCEHADVIFDERASENYSMQHDLTLLHQHSIGDGKKVIVLTGLGFIDIDHFDGSFDRVMNDALKFFMEAWPKYKEHYEEFDIYIMRHIIHTRDEYVYPSSLFGTDEAKVIAKQWSKEREYLIEDSYNLISPENDKKVLTLSIDIHPNVRIVPIMGTTLCLSNWDKNYKNINHYYYQRNVSPALDLDMLKVFSSRNTSLRYNILYTSINSTEQFEKEFYGFFGF